MRKKSFYFTIVCLCLGAALTILATTLLILGYIRDDCNALQTIIYLLIICGGAFLIFFNYRSWRLHQQECPDPSTVAAKQREEALQQLRDFEASRKSLLSKSLSLVILTVAAYIFLIFYGIAKDVDPAPKSNELASLSYESAEVLEIPYEAYQGSQMMEDRPAGEQYLRLKISTGRYAGKIFSAARNSLSIYYGTVLEVGDQAIIAIPEDKVAEIVDISYNNNYQYLHIRRLAQDDADSEPLVIVNDKASYCGDSVEIGDYIIYSQGENDANPALYSEFVYDFDRTSPVIFVILAFLLATIFVGGRVGAKSLLGLGLTILCIFTILFPLLIGGWPTLPTVLGLCAYVTIVEFVIMGGVNKKIICAILGTISGVAIAMLFGELFGEVLRLNGYQMQSSVGEVEPLGQLRQQQGGLGGIQINDLLVGGILIAALGAVNDVAMSISSAMNELVTVNPNLTRKELFKSGMNIGRDMVGTMTNTLILALVGGSFVEILYYSSLDITFRELMSTTYFPMEVMQAVASSIGVILAVPLSVVCGMMFFASWQKHKQNSLHKNK